MTQPTDFLYHIVQRAEWESSAEIGFYAPASIAEEGFIHCSTLDQVVGTANRFYNGQTGLVLLQMDVAQVSAEIVYEDLYGHGQAFPHIYGPLNVDAVSAVVDFPPNADGTFSLPSTLQS